MIKIQNLSDKADSGLAGPVTNPVEFSAVTEAVFSSVSHGDDCSQSKVLVSGNLSKVTNRPRCSVT